MPAPRRRHPPWSASGAVPSRGRDHGPKRQRRDRIGARGFDGIGDRGTRTLQELKELFAGNGMVGYVMKERVDGKLILPEAVKLLKIKGTAAKASA